MLRDILVKKFHLFQKLFRSICYLNAVKYLKKKPVTFYFIRRLNLYMERLIIGTD